jgi:hypothetical protein
MSESFDPYEHWLGIAPHERPADHYRLLGLTRFEPNPQVIADGADQRMACVRSFQTGPRGVYTQALLNELAAARRCLLNPATKASYDQMLQGMLLAGEFQAPELPPVAVPEAQSAAQFQPFSLHSAVAIDEYGGDSQPSRWPSLVALTLGVLVVVALGFVTWKVIQRMTSSGASALDPGFSTQDLNREPAPVLATREQESEPVLVHQEANGTVNLEATTGQLHGPNLKLAISGNVDVIAGWKSMDDWVRWRFKLIEPPPQGVFHVTVTYAAHPDSDGGQYVISIGEQEKVCEVRGTGEALTDEFFLAVPRNGEHTLEIRPKSKPGSELMTLKSVTLGQKE